MLSRILSAITVTIFSILFLIDYTHAAEKRLLVAGWVEKVKLYPGGLVVKAKLDSGARTSSLNVKNMKRYEKDGKQWVKFDFENSDGKRIVIDRPIVRTAKVKVLGSKSKQRPVIMLGFCIGNIFGETEVNLVDRTGFNYQLLLGRRFLQKKVYVDVASRNKTTPECNR